MAGPSNARAEPLLGDKVGGSQSRQEYDLICATFMFEDAIAGHFAERYPHGRCTVDLRKRKSIGRWLSKGYDFCMTMLLLLLLFETPPWCYRPPESEIPLWSYDCQLQQTQSDGSVAYVNLETFGQPFLRWDAYLCLEFFCLLVVGGSLIHEALLATSFANFTTRNRTMSRLSPSNSITRAWLNRASTDETGEEGPGGHKANRYPERLLFVLFIMIVDRLSLCTLGRNLGLDRYGRLALCFHSPRTRSVFTSALLAMKDLLNIVILWISTVVLFAWLILTIINDLQDVKVLEPGDAAEAGFTDFGSSVMSLMAIATGSSFPDPMDPLVRKVRWVSIIFFIFAGLTVLLFTQLMLAVVYNAYQVDAKRRLKEFHVQRNKALSTIFMLLSAGSSREAQDRSISFDVFADFVKHLSRLPGMWHLRIQGAEDIFFQALDDDKSHSLSAREFLDACESLMFQFWVTPRDSFLVRCCGARLDPLKDFIERGKLDKCIYCLMLSNVVLIVAESYFDFNNLSTPPILESLESLLSLLYLADVLLRLSVFSFSAYWSLPGNRFDFIVSWTLFIMGSCTFIPGLAHLRPVLTYLSVFRVLRILRLVRNIQRFQTLVGCLRNLWLIAGDLLLMVAITVLTFAMVGYRCFGGLLYTKNPALEGSNLVQEGYIMWNFNDMLSGICTIFIMLVNSYMTDYITALNVVSSFPYAGTAFCCSLFFVGVNIGLNIVTAFSIDVFVSLESLQQTSRGIEEEAEEVQNLRQMRSILEKQGKNLHMSVPFTLRRMKALAGVIDGLEDAIREAQDEVLHAFSSHKRELFLETEVPFGPSSSGENHSVLDEQPEAASESPQKSPSEAAQSLHIAKPDVPPPLPQPSVAPATTLGTSGSLSASALAPRRPSVPQAAQTTPAMPVGRSTGQIAQVLTGSLPSVQQAPGDGSMQGPRVVLPSATRVSASGSHGSPMQIGQQVTRPAASGTYLSTPTTPNRVVVWRQSNAPASFGSVGSLRALSPTAAGAPAAAAQPQFQTSNARVGLTTSIADSRTMTSPTNQVPFLPAPTSSPGQVPPMNRATYTSRFPSAPGPSDYTGQRF